MSAEGGVENMVIRQVLRAAEYAGTHLRFDPPEIDGEVVGVVDSGWSSIMSQERGADAR